MVMACLGNLENTGHPLGRYLPAHHSKIEIAQIKTIPHNNQFVPKTWKILTMNNIICYPFLTYRLPLKINHEKVLLFRFILTLNAFDIIWARAPKMQDGVGTRAVRHLLNTPDCRWCQITQWSRYTIF